MTPLTFQEIKNLVLALDLGSEDLHGDIQSLQEKVKNSAAPTEGGKPSALWTSGMQAAAQAAIDHNKDALLALHGRSIGSMTRQGSMVMQGAYPALTEKGEKIAAEYGIKRSENYVDIPENHNAISVKRIVLNDKQKLAIQAAISESSADWKTIHGKTHKVVKREGWVSVSDNGVPSLTPLGFSIAAMNGISIPSGLTPSAPVEPSESVVILSAVVKEDDALDDDEGIGEVVFDPAASQPSV